jgi:isoquinoline 1-oxidoreductase
MPEATRIDRREFVQWLGGGILVVVNLPMKSVLSPHEEAQRRQRGYPEDINAYLHIAEDGAVTLYSGKIEMGQGVMTSLTQEAAEELGVALNAIRIVMGDTDTCPWDRGTFGSLTTRMFGPAVRAAAAQARLVLTDLAARRLGVPRASLTAENGVVYVTRDRSRKVSYGELARGQRITHTLNERAVLRAVEQFAVMNRSPQRLDGYEKVTGQAKYAGDIRRPGMLYARILRPPTHGARLTRVETAAARAMPGVTVVAEDGLVAVLAADPETAEQALTRVEAEFDTPAPEVDTESIFDHIVRVAPAPDTPEREGDLVSGRRQSVKTFDAAYYNSYVAHAPMEPHTAVAEIVNGRATVWSSTQAPFSQQETIARAIGFQPEAVRVITPYVGGGFGGKVPGQQAVEAARLAQLTGKPVQVCWTRAEEFFYDTFRPAAVIKVTSGIDAAGRVVLWDYHVYGAGSRGSDVFYDIANRSVRVYGEWGRAPEGMHPFAVGAWRAPAANSNRFAAEQQIDMMAAAAGMDPLAFRLENTTDERMIAVLNAVADAYEWESAVAPRKDGRGRGLACGIDAETYVALAADVRVDANTGVVTVDRVVCAQDMGLVVNPDGARMQMEGCIAMGLGYVFSEEVRFEGGTVLDTNFDTYGLARFSWMPTIETVTVPNDALPPKGGGEPAIINMGAVVANAIFDATGARVYRLPMTPERVLAAIGGLG